MQIVYMLANGYEHVEELPGVYYPGLSSEHPSMKLAKELVKEQKIYGDRPYTLLKRPYCFGTTPVYVEQILAKGDHIQRKRLYHLPVRLECKPFYAEELSAAIQQSLGPLADEHRKLVLSILKTTGRDKYGDTYQEQWETLRLLRQLAVEICHTVSPELAPSDYHDDAGMFAWPDETRLIRNAVAMQDATRSKVDLEKEWAAFVPEGPSQELQDICKLSRVSTGRRHMREVVVGVDTVAAVYRLDADFVLSSNREYLH